MLNEIIKRIYESGEYAGIYANAEDTSKFMYGRIVAFDGEFFAASLVSPDGAFDGITVQDAESVIRIELDGGYSARMKKLMAGVYAEEKFDISCEDVRGSALEAAKKAGCIVSIELLGSGISDVIGIVEDTDGGMYRIAQVNEDGSDDGISYISRDAITELGFASADERRIERLHK